MLAGNPTLRTRNEYGDAAPGEYLPFLVHGDIHEDQLLADGGRLTGIIDWETARVDHPFWDFDLGEWGTGMWRRRRRDFSALWARAWRAYAQTRGLDTDSRRSRPPFASGTRFISWRIPAIPPSSAGSRSTWRSCVSRSRRHRRSSHRRLAAMARRNRPGRPPQRWTAA